VRRKVLLPLAGGLLLALASVVEAGAASPIRPVNLAYRDPDSGVDVRLSTAGRFVVVAPNGVCAGQTAPITDRRYRADVVGGAPGCVVEAKTDQRTARGWVLLPAKRYHLSGSYVRIEFQAKAVTRASGRPLPPPSRMRSARRVA
jgi:hypothetical protein